jgi:hypothetical protein
MAVTAAVRSSAARPLDDTEQLGAGVEAQINALVEAGADEAAVRALVGDAVRLGRSRS